MIERLLPAVVSAAETCGDLIDPGPAFDGEVMPGGWSLERRTEFVTVRALARRALIALGEPPAAIPRAQRGEPAWPPGVVGSMTHCPGYCAAAVARAGELFTIGVDAEPNRPLPNGVLEVVALPAERARHDRLAARHPGVHWDRLLFCAKEALYKAWFPVTGRWLGFEDAEIALHPDGTFHTRLLAPDQRPAEGPVARFVGRWLREEELLLTAIASPRSGGVDVGATPKSDGGDRDDAQGSHAVRAVPRTHSATDRSR